MKKILIIRFSSIGDIVLCTPVIRALKKQVPKASIHFLTKRSYEGLLRNNPYIDKLHFLDKGKKLPVEELKQESFDFIVDLHNNLRSTLVKASLRKPSAAFPKLNIQKWMKVNLRIDVLPERHIVDRYFEAAAPLGVMNDGLGLDFFIDKQDVVDVSRFNLTSGSYVAFAIGGKFATKRMPDEKIISIIQKINFPIILLGGKEDEESAARIVNATGNKVISACGKLNIGQSASVIGQARLVISQDTGMMHVAAALKKEIVSVWGNTIPGFGMYPYYGNAKVRNYISEVNGLSCRPCSKLGYSKCPRGHFLCMKDHDEAKIAEFVNRS